MDTFITWIIFGLPIFIISGTIHEYMHAWTAKRLGDYTAQIEGRLTLNPLRHLDLTGFLLMVFARFGWMKPVPVDERNFEKPILGMALTAAAGPASNFFMALIAGFAYRVLVSTAYIDNVNAIASTELMPLLLGNLLYTFIWVNLALGLFNLLPIPPLDGYRIVRAFLPQKLLYYWEDLENYAPILLLLIFLPFSPLSKFTGALLSKGVDFLLNIVIGA